MVDEPENLTLRLLQEMRAEMREQFARIDDRFSGIEQRIDGNTVLLNLLAGLAHDHEQRLASIEAAKQ